MTHSNRGQAFEALVEAVNMRYLDDGLAAISKAETGWTVIGYDGRSKRAHGQVFPKRKVGVDFYGTLRGGRSVYFDAKETKVATRFPFDNVHEHQLEFLRERSELGAITFLLVHVEPLGRCFLVDVEAIDTARDNGKASLSLKELEQGIEVPWVLGLPDYLFPIFELLEGKR